MFLQKDFARESVSTEDWYIQKAGNDKEITEASMPTHKEAIQMVLEALTNDKTGAIKSLDEVNAIGHRIVHGGEKFASSAMITDEMIKTVEECNDLAPLHNPANLIGIRYVLSLCRMYRRLVYSIQLSIRQCLQKHICTDFRSSTTRTYKVRRYGFPRNLPQLRIQTCC